MKFSEMPYVRLNGDDLKAKCRALTGRLRSAADYQDARTVFMEMEDLQRTINTQSTLAMIRHDIDTRDPFYDGERAYWDELLPELEEHFQEFTAEMLTSPFRADFTAEFGELMFLNAEIARKTFSPEIIPELQKENELTQTYGKLLASARIAFEEGEYTLSQMTPFMTDADDERRLAAWKAEGGWYRDRQEKLDRIYDELVRLRDGMGKKLGYEGFTSLGYYRMGRNCYGKADVERFREAVRTYLVPLADKVCRQRAARLGKEYPLSFADNALSFRSGNPRPRGTADDILAQGDRFYDELSPETGEFFRAMRAGELMDGLSREGKAGGG